MEMRYSSYRVEIINIKFVSENGIQYPRTAVFTFLDHNNEELSTDLLGYIDTHDIYASIDAEKDIVLDNCLVEDFSLSVYRQQKNINRKEYVCLKGFWIPLACF